VEPAGHAVAEFEVVDLKRSVFSGQRADDHPVDRAGRQHPVAAKRLWRIVAGGAVLRCAGRSEPAERSIGRGSAGAEWRPPPGKGAQHPRGHAHGVRAALHGTRDHAPGKKRPHREKIFRDADRGPRAGNAHRL